MQVVLASSAFAAWRLEPSRAVACSLGLQARENMRADRKIAVVMRQNTRSRHACQTRDLRPVYALQQR